MTPEISVVLAFRDARAHLAAAVRSIQEQDFGNFELILIDDGSVDDGLDLMRHIAATDRRVVLIRQDKLGLATALNAGIEAARAPWIARMDADDIALPSRLRRQLEFARRTDVDLCGSSIRTFGKTLPRRRDYYQSHDAIRLQLLFNSAFCHPAVFGKRQVFEALRYDSSIAAAQDYDLWTRAGMSGFRMANIDEVLLKYRVHRSQVTARRFLEQTQALLQAANGYWCWMTAGPLGWTGERCARVSQLVADKTARLCAEGVEYALLSIDEVAGHFGDPESVVSDNAAKFLLRAGHVVPLNTLLTLRLGRLSGLMRAGLIAARTFGPAWHNPLTQFARRHLR